MLILTTLLMATLVVSAMLAAAPILFSRWLRPAMQGTGGMLCVVGGAAGFFAIASGLAENVGSAGSALAAETTSDAAAAKTPDESAFFTTSSAPQAADAHSTSLNTLPQSLSEEVIIPPGRPAWVKSEPVRSGETHSTAVTSGPFKKDNDARQALDSELEAETAAYISETLGSKLAPQFIRYDASRIKSELVTTDHVYRETIESPTVGSMEQYHALVQFGPHFQERIKHEWNDVRAKWRLAQLGLVAGGVILLLGTVFSYFRVDNATRGYYTGRLQFLSAAAILGIVGAGVILARWIHWL